MTAPLLRITDLAVRYQSSRGEVQATRGVSLTVAAGETVALVGESGSGKSTTAHAVVGLLGSAARVTGGSIELGGRNLVRASARELRAVRGRQVGLVPQDPTVSLNPVVRIGVQVAEVLRVHGLADRRAARSAAIEALRRAGIPDPEVRAEQYPHELSGGMRQRVLIAIAIIGSPQLIIADEPTSALDVTVQAQILDHLSELAAAAGTGVLLITHDLGVAADRADRIVVMSHGQVVEEGAPGAVLGAPQHAYTRALLAAAPSLHTDRSLVRSPSAGEVVVTAPATVLAVEHLVKDFPLSRAAGGGALRAVDDVSFRLGRGRTLALVGESGSGKSTTARLALRLATPTSGRILVDDEDVTFARGAALRDLRRRVQIVYQNPFSSLNPRLSVADLITDPLRAFGLASRAERARRAEELVDLVALPASALARRAAELSGGQRQRVAIARALALDPEVVVLDEPVSALDVSVQAQILELLVRLQDEIGLSYLFISHDLAVVRQISHEVAVLQRGRIVETGDLERVFTAPAHEYTAELLAAIPGRRTAGRTGGGAR